MPAGEGKRWGNFTDCRGVVCEVSMLGGARGSRERCGNIEDAIKLSSC